METYWTALSCAYQVKVKEIARDHSVNTNTVMRNLEGYLKNEQPGICCSSRSFITVKELEALIDNIAQPTM